MVYADLGYSFVADLCYRESLIFARFSDAEMAVGLGRLVREYNYMVCVNDVYLRINDKPSQSV